MSEEQMDLLRRVAALIKTDVALAEEFTDMLETCDVSDQLVVDALCSVMLEVT